MKTKEKVKAKEATSPGMGAIPHKKGVTFRVWAPNAKEVGVIGTFNEWEEAFDLSHEGDGYWAGDVEDAKAGDEYKFVIIDSDGNTLHRNDPYAREVTHSDGNSIVIADDYEWKSDKSFDLAPWNKIVIYEMHIGTFNDEDDGDGRPGTFQEAIDKLDYLERLGVNALQIMPPTEFPGGYSWGYNPAHPFAIEQDYGGVDGFKKFVDAAHAKGMAVIVDVVYNHFGPSDLDLWRFDGWYEHEGGGIYFYNDQRGETPWGHTRPDYGRSAVRQYIRDNALMWLNTYRVDGLRWDATSYIHNIHGNDMDPANELSEGWSLMQWINDEIDAISEAKLTIAEDLRGNAWITKTTGEGGAGFSSQWDSQFVHPIRAALIAQDDAFRDMEAVANAIQFKYGDDAFHRIIYTESHDEVANGKARLPEEIWPGNHQSFFSKKRSTLGAAVLFTAPGIPMIFQGQELLRGKWFEDTRPINWDDASEQFDVANLYHDLIHLRRNTAGNTAALTGQGVAITHVNNNDKLIAFRRWAGEDDQADNVVVLLNFSNRSWDEYMVGFPQAGDWELLFDSHAQRYDSEYEGQISQSITAVDKPYDNLPAAAKVAIAPYSALIFSQG